MRVGWGDGQQSHRWVNYTRREAKGWQRRVRVCVIAFSWSHTSVVFVRFSLFPLRTHIQVMLSAIYWFLVRNFGYSVSVRSFRSPTRTHSNGPNSNSFPICHIYKL